MNTRAMHRTRGVGIGEAMALPLLIVVLLLLFAGEARGAPPVLVSVSSQSQHPAATWTLPSGVEAKTIEVATSPVTASDGSFFAENRRAFDLLEDAQTSWLYAYKLDPGTYYVHVAGLDEPCFSADQCPVREYSAVMTLVIEAPAPTPPVVPPATVAKAPRPLAAARISGPFDVALRVTSSRNIDKKRGAREQGTFTFTPQCRTGVCAVRLHFHFGLAGGKSLTMRLSRHGAAYDGAKAARLSQCFYKDVQGRLRVHLTVRRAAWINDVWRATRVTGTYRYTFPQATSGIYRCPGGSLTAAITGTLSQ